MNIDIASQSSMDSFSHLIGKRLKMARESYTQEDLASALGLKDRQSISAIELGERRITPEELIKAADFLGKSVEFFTDPYIVPESKEFSFRAKTLDSKVLGDFSERATRLISAHRRFRDLLGETSSPIHTQLLGVTKRTSLKVASSYGEQTAAAWGLGQVPAERLREVAEEKIGISILFVDGDAAVSGAACRLDDGDVIIVNRNESEGRRNFNIGHEIFHLLTWHEMPPEPLDLESDTDFRPKSQCERLADNYSGGLLMPSSVVRARWEERKNQTLVDWLLEHAAEMHVSPAAMYWRLVNLELIDKDEHPFPAGTKAKSSPGQIPLLYNRPFVARLQKVLERGNLSVIRATEILDCSIEELVELFESYNLEVPFGY